MTHPASRTGPLRRAAGLAYALMHLRRGGMVRPTDHTVVRSGSPEQGVRRVLLVANGIGHGWGVASHRAAPTGRLAAALAAATGLGCEVEFVGDAAMSAQTAPLWLEGRADRSFDCAVVAIGSNDAMRLTPARDWEARLGDLLDAVRRDLPDGAPIVVVGIPDVYAAQRVRRMSALLRRRARRLDSVSRRVVGDRPATRFVPSPDLRPHTGSVPDAALYEAFAAALTAVVGEAIVGGAAEIPAAAETFGHDTVRAVVEARREGALLALEEILARARDRFGVMESAVTMVDGGRTWHVAHGGTAPMQVPASLTGCPIVVDSDRPLVVENLERDPRFASNGFLDLEHARFYAGAPVHAPDGSAIGALCLLHAFPRDADRVDLDELQAFAQEADEAIRELVAARADGEAAVRA
ncbi:GAF domain-containing protein [uncultured Amnibacterium sp.]|uniref:GAF domain-containing protein n=1 Tax=uncultured Amnibacterium sp. TaxID=1631851 RepID=UPI0035CA1E3E